jgi:hypothetical protein
MLAYYYEEKPDAVSVCVVPCPNYSDDRQKCHPAGPPVAQRRPGGGAVPGYSFQLMGMV